MTDNVVLSPNRTVESHPITKTIAHGAASPGWIVPSGDPTYSVAVSHDEFNSTLNAFAISTETSSLTVTIETGEAFLEGAWVARNETEDVTLSANSTTMLYLGYSIESPDTILIGDETTVLDDPDVRRMELFEVETDASGVPSGGVTDRRTVGRRIETPNTLYDSDQSGIVDQAEHATTADTADSADVATNAASADVADNANALGGAGPSQYARLGESETVTSQWNFDAHTTFKTLTVSSSDGGAQFGSSGDRFWIAPQLNNSPQYGSEITYYAGPNRWDIETNLNVTGGNVDVTNGELQTQSGWATTSGTQRKIVKNGTDGSGTINFKTQ